MPAIYHKSFSTVDPTNSGETSVNSLSRVLSTSSLPAATVDKVTPCTLRGTVDGKALTARPPDRQPCKHTPTCIEARVLRRASTRCACSGRQRCVIDS